MEERWGQGKHIIKEQKTEPYALTEPGNSKPKRSLVETLITVEKDFVWSVFVGFWEEFCVCSFVCLFMGFFFFCLWGLYFLVFVCFLLSGLFFGCVT